MEARRRVRRPSPAPADGPPLTATPRAARRPRSAETAQAPAARHTADRPEPAAPSNRFNIAGAIDGLIGGSIFGWAYDRDFGRRRVRITMYVDDRLAAEAMANGLRRELAGIGSHDGFSGFVCAIPPESFAAGAAIRVFADGIELTQTPLLLGPHHIDGIFEPLDGVMVSGWVRERTRETTRAELDMLVDGAIVRTIIADRLRDELKAHGVGDGQFGFAETLPTSCLDGGEHEILLRHRASGTMLAPGPRRFRARYGGFLERLDQYGGAGWVCCREAPDRPIGLDILIGGERIGVVADQARPDVQAASGIAAWGFEFHIPHTVSRHQEIVVDILIAGTENPAIRGPFRFTPVSRLIEQLEEFAAAFEDQEKPMAAGADRPSSAIRDTIVPSLVAALRSQGPRGGPVDVATRLDPSVFRAPPPPVADIVDVIIPVYSGYDETIACIESVIRSVNTTRREIVVVDDCGPDARLRAALRDFQRAGTITLIVNPANLGFPGAANAGMSLHPDRDVILLNADTLVPRGWIDRLRAAAYRAVNTGSVTPLSNRATICSYPEINKDNDLPGDIEWEGLDQICAGVNDARSVELPTAVGFCSYLKRAMLREVGLLNAERWKRGYGEENELCILAAAHGWKHLLAADVFIVHHGAVSFGANDRRALLETNLGTLSRLYPDYVPRVMEFLREDPVAAVRRAIDWARLKRLSDRFMLFVSHRYGGGIAVHVEEMARRLAEKDCHVLILEANADHCGTATIRNLTLGTRSIYSLPREADVLVDDLRACGIWHIHFHQVMGSARWAALPAELDCAYDVTVHDYSFFCPRIDLIDDRRQYCGEPAVAVCERCISLNGPHQELAGAFRRQGSMAAWLDLHGRLLAGARRAFVPSRDTAARMERHLADIDYTVRPHPEQMQTVAVRRPASVGAARVAIVGAIGPHKGYDLLIACARDALKQGLPLQFHIFGYTVDDAPLRQLANVRLIGEYTRADLPRLVAKNPCDVALFLSIWPETYCYALSDAYAAGLYPLALRFGAFEERLEASHVGTLLPLASTPAQINAAILAAVAGSNDWPRTVSIGHDVTNLLAEYYGLPQKARSPRRQHAHRNTSKQVDNGQGEI
jgi:GT2 family glycosyltransferase